MTDSHCFLSGRKIFSSTFYVHVLGAYKLNWQKTDDLEKRQIFIHISMWEVTEKCDSRCLEFGAWFLIREEKGKRALMGKINDF